MGEVTTVVLVTIGQANGFARWAEIWKRVPERSCLIRKITNEITSMIEFVNVTFECQLN